MADIDSIPAPNSDGTLGGEQSSASSSAAVHQFPPGISSKGVRAAHENTRRARLFAHVSADHSPMYRAIMEVFANARDVFQPQLRPDEVMRDLIVPPGAPLPDNHLLTQHLDALVTWGNLEAQQDMARRATIEDFKRNLKIYRLSREGEAVEEGLKQYENVLRHRAELQTVALADIEDLLRALAALNRDADLDAPKLHANLRDLMNVFATMTDNASRFMAGVDRSLGSIDVDFQNVERYKSQLIDYLKRFVSDLARRGDTISDLIRSLDHSINLILITTAEFRAQDAPPGEWTTISASNYYREEWRNKWFGLRRWFIGTDDEVCTADLLRQKARSAIRQLGLAIKEINDRRTGRSDRATDLRTLASWFLSCDSDVDAHRLARAAFGLNPTRHMSLDTEQEDTLPANTPWADAPPLQISPRLYQSGDGTQRGQFPAVKNREELRKQIQRMMADESGQAAEARRRFATGLEIRLSDLGSLNASEFSLFLALLGEALDHQKGPDDPVEVLTADGSLLIRLDPLGPDTCADIVTPGGLMSGRDHTITIAPT
jgi:uncharacterized protein (TIGR02677 family)